MEIWKSISEFITGVLGSLAWPVVVVLFLWRFKIEIKGFIKRISKIEGKAATVFFTKQIEESIIQDTQEEGSFLDATRQSLPYEKYLDAIAFLGVFFGIYILNDPDSQSHLINKKILFRIEKKLTEEGYNKKLMSSFLKLTSTIRDCNI